LQTSDPCLNSAGTVVGSDRPPAEEARVNRRATFRVPPIDRRKWIAPERGQDKQELATTTPELQFVICDSSVASTRSRRGCPMLAQRRQRNPKITLPANRPTPLTCIACGNTRVAIPSRPPRIRADRPVSATKWLGGAVPLYVGGAEIDERHRHHHGTCLFMTSAEASARPQT